MQVALTTEDLTQLTDVLVTLAIVWVWAATAYVASGKLEGWKKLSASDAPGARREYVLERVDWVLIGSLVPLSATLLYYTLLAFNLTELESNGTARLFIFRVPFILWLALLGLHLFNGRINALLRVLDNQWKHFHIP